MLVTPADPPPLLHTLFRLTRGYQVYTLSQSHARTVPRSSELTAKPQRGKQTETVDDLRMTTEPGPGNVEQKP